jgi:pimeloyl-ACP methyl ester carboxylesterase
VLGLIDELGLHAPVIAGYDIGSRIAQTIARTTPDRARAIVVSPPLPGVGERVLSAGAQHEFWYQAFHQLDLAAELLDGKPTATRAYLRHFWSHWSGPAYQQPEADLDRLATAFRRRALRPARSTAGLRRRNPRRARRGKDASSTDSLMLAANVREDAIESALPPAHASPARRAD